MRNFQEILERIAKENGTTPDNVLQEMQRAIDEAFDHHDADAQPIWDMMTFKGRQADTGRVYLSGCDDAGSRE